MKRIQPLHTTSRKTHQYRGQLIILAVIACIAVVAGILRLFSATSAFYRHIYTPGSTAKEEAKKTDFDIVLMGYGGGNHEGTYLTDTLMIAHIDTVTKKVTLISIPRDTWARIPGTGEKSLHAKINSIYQMGLFSKQFPAIIGKYRGEQGAAELIKDTLQYITGRDVDYYVAIDFAGFQKAVDVLGGVDITVDRAFDDYRYPVEGKKDDPCGKEGVDLEEAVKAATESPELIFPCRYEHLHFDVGPTHMSGETALKFVRSRQSAEDGGDFARARRQQLFLEALRKKIISIGFIPKIIPLMDEMGMHIRTDVPPEVLKKFVNEADNLGEYKIEHVILTTDNYLKATYSPDRQYILVPQEGVDRWVRLKKVISDTIRGITPTPSTSVIKSPTR